MNEDSDITEDQDESLQGEESLNPDSKASKDKKKKKRPGATTSPDRVKDILSSRKVLDNIRKNAKRPNVAKKHLEIIQNAGKKMTENGGKMKPAKALKEAAKEAGLSENYIESGKLQKTDSWQKILEEHPAYKDSELAKHHDMLMNAVKIGHQTFGMGVKDDEIIEVIESFGFPVMKILFVPGMGKVAYYSIADNIAKKYALEMAYKLKQKYGDITIHHEFGNLSDEEIEGEIAGVISEALGLEEGEEEEGAE